MSEKEKTIEAPVITEEEIEERLKIAEVCPLPKTLTFKGIRAVVMDRVWQKADELEAKGVPLTHTDFANMLRAEWKVMKKTEIPKAIKDFEACKKRASLLDVVKEVEAEEVKDLKDLLPEEAVEEAEEKAEEES